LQPLFKAPDDFLVVPDGLLEGLGRLLELLTQPFQFLGLLGLEATHRAAEAQGGQTPHYKLSFHMAWTGHSVRSSE
jgi:hypothetical protein